jgi:signal transduction histidine kinase/ActR/RegA family two-component response regulator
MDEDLDELGPQAASWLWRTIIGDMPHMISVKDVDTRRYLFCNPECDKILGPDAVGRTNFELLDEVVAGRIEAEETVLIDGGGVTIVETRVIDRTGRFWTMRTKKFVVSAPKDRRYLVTVSEDVSEKHEHARQLDEAMKAADAANAAKSTFLATMSHEIRTPLNGVLGMAQAMAADDLPTVQRERLEVIRQSGQTLLTILNDILDVSKIEAGKLELEDGTFDLAVLLRSVEAPFSCLADEKGVALSVEITPSAEGRYGGDPVRVRQILYNLVSNGVKFTQQGEVRLTASRPADDLVIEVADTGLGIPRDRLEAMFEKFTQADAAVARRFGGTGLGLSICRELCQLMGGTVTVASEPGAGTVFTVRLPLPWLGAAGEDCVAPGRTAASGVELQPGVKVLAAEDNPVNQLVLKTLLNQGGLDPVLVGDGRLAVEAWEREAWDLILMDVKMPVMDGIEACKAIRAREAQAGRRRTPIIALTADAMDHHAQAYLDAGMDSHVAKPIDVGELFDCMSRILSSN